MHFKNNERPPVLEVRDSHLLVKDDIVIDEYGAPWIIQANNEVLAVLNNDRQIVAHRYRACQLVWKDEKLKRDIEVMLIDLSAGKVHTYHPGDIVRAVQASIAEFDAKLAAL